MHSYKFGDVKLINERGVYLDEAKVGYMYYQNKIPQLTNITKQ